MAVGAGKHLQQHHHQLVPRFHRVELQRRVLRTKLAADGSADGVLNHPHLTNHVAFRHVDAGICSARGVGTAYIVYIACVLIVVDGLRGAKPEVRQVSHAQHEIGLIDRAVWMKEKAARERVT